MDSFLADLMSEAPPKLKEKPRNKKLHDKQRLEKELEMRRQRERDQERAKLDDLRKAGILKEPRIAKPKAPRATTSRNGTTTRKQATPTQPRQRQSQSGPRIQSVCNPFAQTKSKQPSSSKIEEKQKQQQQQANQLKLNREDSEGVYKGKPIKKLKVDLSRAKAAIDDNDEIAERLANCVPIIDFCIKPRESEKVNKPPPRMPILELGRSKQESVLNTIGRRPSDGCPPDKVLRSPPRVDHQRKQEAYRRETQRERRPAQMVEQTRQPPVKRPRFENEHEHDHEREAVHRRRNDLPPNRKPTEKHDHEERERKVKLQQLLQKKKELERLKRQKHNEKVSAQRSQARRPAKVYDPTDDWDDYESRSRDNCRQSKAKKRLVETGFAGQQYVYRGSSADEDDIEEADFTDIEEEEFVSGMIADKEDEEERQRQRDQRRFRKWKKLVNSGQDELLLEQVSYDATSEDDY